MFIESVTYKLRVDTREWDLAWWRVWWTLWDKAPQPFQGQLRGSTDDPTG